MRKGVDKEECLMRHRHATDLPEMQPLASCQLGRFVFWRDTPECNKPLIVFVDDAEHFPKTAIVGASDPMYMLAYLIGSRVPDEYKHFFSKTWLEQYDILVGNVKTIIKRRKHETVGYPLHGLGLSIKIINGVGYREIPDCPGAFI
ncbi:unnamed protein product [Gongylonema pulchrum]|uniref:MULE domain-containing protein n=1 Tax=Gongylonema pulchrum TaxID=637853 RepID=A0A183EWK1_9BILA|nr:unnamed protein product [Gongylonema pulchrum]